MIKHIFLGACAVFTLAIVACTGGTGGTPSASSSSGGGTGVSRGSETAPAPKEAPTSSSATGESCTKAEDCALWYCRCKDGVTVNSHQCYNGACQAPSAHCEYACTALPHGGWSGVAGGGTTSGGASSSSSSSSSSGSSGASDSCTKKEECAPFECGCTDGSRISVRDCFGGVCNDANGGCQSACEDSGRGGWDGT